jgi:hypothetical protein
MMVNLDCLMLTKYMCYLVQIYTTGTTTYFPFRITYSMERCKTSSVGHKPIALEQDQKTMSANWL